MVLDEQTIRRAVREELEARRDWSTEYIGEEIADGTMLYEGRLDPWLLALAVLRAAGVEVE